MKQDKEEKFYISQGLRIWGSGVRIAPGAPLNTMAYLIIKGMGKLRIKPYSLYISISVLNSCQKLAKLFSVAL